MQATLPLRTFSILFTVPLIPGYPIQVEIISRNHNLQVASSGIKFNVPQVPFIFTDFHPIIGAIARRQVELTDIDLHMSLNLMPLGDRYYLLSR
jgi:hypothetical protein